MAIFSMNIAKVSKSNGSSAVNSSAYIHREKYRAEETGLLYDWTSKAKEEAEVFNLVMLPQNAPAEYEDPQVLWNAVEQVEKNSNALLARRIIVALPEELSLEQNKVLLQRYAQKNFVDEGMCVDMAIHWKEGNPHAHLLLTTRPIKKNGEWGAKEKKVYKLDENGERIPVLNEDGNQKTDSRNRKQWQRETVEAFSVNHRNMAEEWRSSWAEECNRYLTRENHIDHRSYERQGLDITPQVHVGYSPRRALINAQIKKIRDSIKFLIGNLKSLKTEISVDYDAIAFREKRIEDNRASIRARKWGLDNLKEERESLSKKVLPKSEMIKIKNYFDYKDHPVWQNYIQASDRKRAKLETKKGSEEDRDIIRAMKVVYNNAEEYGKEKDFPVKNISEYYELVKAEKRIREIDDVMISNEQRVNHEVEWLETNIAKYEREIKNLKQGLEPDGSVRQPRQPKKEKELEKEKDEYKIIDYHQRVNNLGRYRQRDRGFEID